MGLTKQYLAYRPVDNFNIITSGRSNVNYVVYNQIEGRYVAAAAGENVIIWDFRLGEKVLVLRRDKHEVTALRASPDHSHVAVGYADGVVEIFDLLSNGASVCTLALHRTAITVLRYDSEGIYLISGGLDTELVVTDVVEQAGRQRLTGHSAAITDAHFLERVTEQRIVVSSSKDTQIKFWNLATRFCFKTIVDNRSEVWNLAFSGSFMFAGSNEPTINVYRISERQTSSIAESGASLESAIENFSIEQDDTISSINVKNCGCLQRGGAGRTFNMVTSPNERVLSCHGKGTAIQSFYICTAEEATERLAKRMKKLRKKQAASINDDNDENASREPLGLEKKYLSLEDEIVPLETVRVAHIAKSIDVLYGSNRRIQLLVGFDNNSLAIYAFEANLKPAKSRAAGKNDGKKQHNEHLLRSITLPGHQSEVRSVAFSSDSLAICSAATHSFKVWDRESLQCLQTVATDVVRCCTFAPGDRYALLGLESGRILIVNNGTGDIEQDIQAHESTIWALFVLPDQTGCVSGGKDSVVKFWDFDLIVRQELEHVGSKSLTLKPREPALATPDDSYVLCLSVSQDMKYLAVGYLEGYVHTYFLDSHKPLLKLYARSSPVLCLDISSDTRLIITGSSDRNVHIYCMQFGDCRRSIFAHDDSVMALAFIPNTHMFFSCGKDGQIKQWDADNFQKILTLPGHIGQAYSLAVSRNGRFLVSCGSDRTLRLFERTEEVLVLEDEQEEERHAQENEQLVTGDDSSVPMLPNLKLASRKTAGAENAADALLECLETCVLFESQTDKVKEPLPLMRGQNFKDANDFLLATLQRIRASELEDALLLLPFSKVIELLERLPQLIDQRYDEVELLCKVTIFLFTVHMKPITSTKSLKPLLQRIIVALQRDVDRLRDITGLNLHGLGILQTKIEQDEGVDLFHEATVARRTQVKRQKAAKRVFLQLE